MYPAGRKTNEEEALPPHGLAVLLAMIGSSPPRNSDHLSTASFSPRELLHFITPWALTALLDSNEVWRADSAVPIRRARSSDEGAAARSGGFA